MESKQAYIEAEIDVVRFDVEDIITTSGNSGENSGGGVVLPDDNW